MIRLGTLVPKGSRWHEILLTMGEEWKKASNGKIALELLAEGPALIDVLLDSNQEFEPRSRARQLADGQIVSPNLEDMYPFLDEAELMDNVIKE